MPFDRLGSLSAQIVGVVILVTGAIKVAAPRKFRDHLSGLRLIPERWLDVAVAVAAGAEGAWGLALLLGLWPNVMLPLSIILMLALSAVTFWSVRAGRAEDCGCYGGIVRPSVGQSLALNGLYVALLLGAVLTPKAAPLPMEWQPILVLAVGIAFAIATEIVRRATPLPVAAEREPSPLEAGRRWSADWSAGLHSEVAGEQIVSFLGPRCPYCKSWVRILNVAHESPDFPDVTGVVAASVEEIDEFVTTTGIRFPIVTIPASLMNTLAPAVPTTVSLESGVIGEVWTGNVSPGFFERFKRSFFPAAGSAAHTS